MAEAMDSGILGMNHRSGVFMDMLSATITRMKEKLMIPDDYEVFMVSSATECWEIIAQSLIREKSLHLYNGAFGEKWFEYTGRIREAGGLSFGLNEIPVLPDNHASYDLLCLTHNETSNGTEIPVPVMRAIRKEFKGMITVDATSSMGGVWLDWEAADVWFASVQKCFGMPPGMGIMVVSPNAMHIAQEVNDSSYYNSLLFIASNFRKRQTPYTPNTLGIYLLGRLFEKVDRIDETDKATTVSAEKWFSYFEDRKINPLTENPQIRSRTVIPFVTDHAENTAGIRKFLSGENIVIGNGYGEWKDNSLRIANFPAIEDREKTALMNALDQYYRRPVSG